MRNSVKIWVIAILLVISGIAIAIPTPVNVDVDIMPINDDNPGNAGNSINVDAGGRVAVVVTSSDFNVADINIVDLADITLGNTVDVAVAIRWRVDDPGKYGGDPELRVHFKKKDLNFLDDGEQELTLTGIVTLNDDSEISFSGTDTVVIHSKNK